MILRISIVLMSLIILMIIPPPLYTGAQREGAGLVEGTGPERASETPLFLAIAGRE